MDPTQVDARYQIQFLPSGGFSYGGIYPDAGPFTDPLYFDQSQGYSIADGLAGLQLASLVQQGVIGTVGDQQLQGPFYLSGQPGSGTPPPWSPGVYAVTLQDGNLAFYHSTEGVLSAPNASISWAPTQLTMDSTGNLRFDSGNNIHSSALTFDVAVTHGQFYLSDPALGYGSWTSNLPLVINAGISLPSGFVLGDNNGTNAYIYLSAGGPAPFLTWYPGFLDGKWATDSVGNVFSGGICTTVGSGSLSLSGDVTGLLASNIVSYIQGFPVLLSSPTSGDVLEWNGSDIVFAPGGGGSLAIGDPISGAVGGAVLFEDGGGNLADSADLTYSPTGGLQVANSPYSAGLATTAAVTASDGGGNSIALCDGSYALNILTGGVAIQGNPGSSGTLTDGSTVLDGIVTGIGSSVPWAAITGTPVTFGGYGLPTPVLVGDTAGGDLSGTYPDPVVSAINGSPLAALSPSMGYVLTWNGSAWDAEALPTPSLAIGEPITGGTPYGMLFGDISNNLDQDSSLTYDPSSGLYYASGSVTVHFTPSTAGTFDDSANIMFLADGTWAANAAAGSITTLGTVGNTYDWGSPSASVAHSGTAATALDLIGYTADHKYLGTPAAWLNVSIGGTQYLLPAYLP